MKRTWILVFVFALLLFGTTTVFAQRGVGDAEGVARQLPPPELLTLEGEVISIEIHPCEQTTGSSDLGAHVLVQAENTELNIHLGPAGAVQHITDLLVPGDFVVVSGFRTEKMLEGHYAAQTISFNGQTFQLRNEYLRPVWAGGRAIRASELDTRSAPSRYPYGWGRGRGHGFGMGRQWRGGRGRW
jgi:hypothetical protein